MRVQADSVAGVDRLLEGDALEGHGDPSMSTMFPGLVKACLVNQGEDDATKDRAEGIGMAGHHVDSKRERFRLVIGHVTIVLAQPSRHKPSPQGR